MQRKLVLVLLLAGLFGGLFILPAIADDMAIEQKKAEVVAFVEKAVAYAKTHGKEAALEEFMNPDGEFIKGWLYIYAYDFDGTVISHGGQAALVGKNLINIKDSENVEVIKELIRLAKAGGGWLKYRWPNPAHANAVETKWGYSVSVDSTWWLGSGFYE